MGESINIEHTNLEGSVPNCQHVEFNLILEASSLGMAESLRALLLQEGRSRARAVDVLVAVHADVNRTNSDGATPLYSAAERGPYGKRCWDLAPLCCCTERALRCIA